MTKFVSLYEAKTGLSRLVEDAAAGEEIVISKNGVPRAKLVAAPPQGKRRKPVNAMKITYIAPDFDAPDPDIVRLFEGE
jgi:prevent-host-death family protein